MVVSFLDPNQITEEKCRLFYSTMKLAK
jgi:hypothetical protein